ncbi:MAG: alkaline phosphatase, partial [Candidatus Binatia bacterium]
MQRRNLCGTVAVLLVTVLLGAALGDGAHGEPGATDRSQALAQAIDGSLPQYVILFLGDGMGDSEITLAR